MPSRPTRSWPTRTTGSEWRISTKARCQTRRTHFDDYLKLAPTGQYAEQAKGILTQIKK